MRPQAHETCCETIILVRACKVVGVVRVLEGAHDTCPGSVPRFLAHEAMPSESLVHAKLQLLVQLRAEREEVNEHELSRPARGLQVRQWDPKGLKYTMG